MKWKDKDVITKGDVCDVLAAISSQKEAMEFLNLCRGTGPHADDNIGYMIGYLGQEAQERLYAWMDISHPIFGNREVTPEEAFKMGVEMGNRGKQEG